MRQLPRLITRVRTVPLVWNQIQSRLISNSYLIRLEALMLRSSTSNFSFRVCLRICVETLRSLNSMDPRTRQKERSYLLRSEAARIRIQTKRRYASAGSIVEGSGLPPDTATHRYNAGPRGSTYWRRQLQGGRSRVQRTASPPAATDRHTWRECRVRSMPTCRQIHDIVEF